MMHLNPDFRDFIALLTKHKVRFLVVGGYAVALHGFPRYTGDIDFFVKTSPENAQALTATFTDFGFSELGVTVQDFLREDFVIEIGREPRKIQVLTGIDGVSFEECDMAKDTVELDGVEIPYISREHLLRNKAASGRPKDRIDIEALTRHRGSHK
ncbi:MAG: nucleotidyl transferase AbiEii/AbiGii toxin family protein [Verrucomicrobiales bacterium]